MQLLETCQKQNTVLLTGYNLRFLPSRQRFRDLLDEGAIGKVLSIRCEIGKYLPSWRPECDYRQGVSARHELGGGVLLEISHELDYLRWIFGEVEWVKATLSRQSSLEIDVEDTAHLTLGFVEKTDGHQLIGTVNLDFIRHDTTRLCTAIGENGSLRWNGLTNEVSLYETGAKEWRELFSHPHQRDDSYIAEWQNFISSVTENKTPLITGEDGLKVLQIIEATPCSLFSKLTRFTALTRLHAKIRYTFHKIVLKFLNRLNFEKKLFGTNASSSMMSNDNSTLSISRSFSMHFASHVAKVVPLHMTPNFIGFESDSGFGSMVMIRRRLFSFLA